MINSLWPIKPYGIMDVSLLYFSWASFTQNCDLCATFEPPVKLSGPWFNIKMPSYQYRKSHFGDKTVVRSSYLHNGISYTVKMTSLYWIRAQDAHWSPESRKSCFCITAAAQILCLHWATKTVVEAQEVPRRRQCGGRAIAMMAQGEWRHSGRHRDRSMDDIGQPKDPDNNVHGANMGPTWVLSAPDGPHVGPMNLGIKVHLLYQGGRSITQIER